MRCSSRAGRPSARTTATSRCTASPTQPCTSPTDRAAGHMPSQRFLELWDEGEESFAIDPPNAVLAFLGDETEVPADVVVVLREPRLIGHQMTYKVDVVDGELPLSGGPCSLFIDAFGRPLSPMSAVG